MVAETETETEVHFSCVGADLSLSAPPAINLRSGSFADIGRRRYMEDEHIRIDNLPASAASPSPSPSAFYAVFDGHGGPDAAAFMKTHALSFLSQHSIDSSHGPHDILSLQTSLTRAFLHADLALSRDASVSRSSGTTALAALLLGRLLLVANAGDCRAVLCRKGSALDLSHDHRPSHAPERQRVIQCGGFFDDGYLNGVLSVTRALGDWDLKCPDNTPCSTPSPLIADPEFKHATLTPDDEFLIIACDGIWDVLSSQQAVSIVRRGLRRHDDPERSARDLAMEALHLNTCDNLTVIVVCFSSSESFSTPEPGSRLRCCKSISVEALCKLRSWLEGEDADGNNS
ncbi:hypothetical protein LUZ63_008743 [Rhynchospora breviuscula]|uniref:protein-serine/threonine phosphatase n=1 Tax=Rhynchospora breviuscula TaxID=2022672 RepID=A0A9Q0CE34_9POAL|nr:hypothetical protein LUZ63_008743 [Rhynchospora breviuscula]